MTRYRESLLFRGTDFFVISKTRFYDQATNETMTSSLRYRATQGALAQRGHPRNVRGTAVGVCNSGRTGLIHVRCGTTMSPSALSRTARRTMQSRSHLHSGECSEQ